jgi:hypothetical protein
MKLIPVEPDIIAGAFQKVCFCCGIIGGGACVFRPADVGGMRERAEGVVLAEYKLAYGKQARYEEESHGWCLYYILNIRVGPINLFRESQLVGWNFE